MDLSVIVPLYNEEESVGPLSQAIVGAPAPVGLVYEILFVDDGSRDATWAKVCALHERDPRVRGVRFSRNFGHQYALLAVLARARGAAVISLDADLQHPPRVIPRLVDEWRKGSRIVHTIRRDSGDETLFKRASSKLFYRVFSFLSGTRLESGMADFRLLDRQVLEGLLSFQEEGLFLRGLVHWVGFPSTQVEFDCEPRRAGRTSYTLSKMLKLAWTGVTSFSLIPENDP